MSTIKAANGWLRLDGSAKRRRDYWLEGFPTVRDDDESSSHGRSEKRVSPIWDYDDGGIGAVQWINPLYDKAIILASDGGWNKGGRWHVWFSHGARTLPVDLTDYVWRLRDHEIRPGEASVWMVRRGNAVSEVEDYFDLGTPSEGLTQ